MNSERPLYPYWGRDTHPEIAARFHRMMKMKTNEERLLMACSMYEAARQLVESSIRSRRPDIAADEMAKEVIHRFYKKR